MFQFKTRLMLAATVVMLTLCSLTTKAQTSDTMVTVSKIDLMDSLSNVADRLAEDTAAVNNIKVRI